ncbi:MAG: ELM1/GtrOC1 family putative glycosyltransferase [Gammaproteobacteria bacterium]
MRDAPLRIWVLSDGRSGHYNQSKGIVKAIASRQLVISEWIDIKLRAGIFRNVMRQLLNRSESDIPLLLLHEFYKVELPKDTPDLIVSSGGRTSFANAWLARHFQVPNIFSGSLRNLRPDLFGAVLSVLPVPDVPNNIVLPVLPSVVDPELLAKMPVPEKMKKQRCWALLIGGDGAGYQYREVDWMLLAEAMNKLSEKFAIKWLVSTAPRTGQSAEWLLKAYTLETSLLAAHWYSEGSESQLLTYLAVAEKIFVTEDSMTMLTEAICTNKPVYSLSPEAVNSDARYSRSMQSFSAQSTMRRYTIEALAHRPDCLDVSDIPQAENTQREILAEALASLVSKIERHNV